MGKFRTRPKGNYIQQADWEDLYALTKLWKSELLFYKEDLRFFHKLIDKYFVLMIQKKNIDKVQEYIRDLLESDKKCGDLLRKVNKHLEQLAKSIENPKKVEARIFRLEHEHLEDEIVSFEQAFKKARKKVFEITDSVLKSKAMVNLTAEKSKTINA